MNTYILNNSQLVPQFAFSFDVAGLFVFQEFLHVLFSFFLIFFQFLGFFFRSLLRVLFGNIICYLKLLVFRAVPLSLGYQRLFKQPGL